MKFKKLLIVSLMVLGLAVSCSNELPSEDSNSISNNTSVSVPTSEETSMHEVVHVSSVSLNKTSLIMRVGDTDRLEATVLPENADDKSVIWSSSDSEVVSVMAGAITAVKEGNATIRVLTKDSNIEATCEITVLPALIEVTSVTLNKEEATIKTTDQLVLEATVLPDYATDKSLRWTSSDESIALVNDGVVTPLKKGVVTIKAISNSGNKEASCLINISDYSSSLVSGKVNGIASSQLDYLDNGTWVVQSYTENDYVYAYYPEYKGRQWAIEVTVSNVLNGLTANEINNNWYTPPVGAAGVNEMGIYTFGALSYCGSSVVTNDFNSYDAALYLKEGNGSPFSGLFLNFARNLGGNTVKSTADYQNGFKVTIIRDGDIYFYLINDIYVGLNNNWVGDGMWEDDYPAISTYKAGATYSDISVYTGESFNRFKTDFYSNYNKMQEIIPTQYPNVGNIDYNSIVNAQGDKQFYAITRDGGLYLTNADEQYVIRANHASTKYYFEAEIDIKHMAQWVYNGNFPWVGIGVGHVGDYDGEHRAMAPVPVINQSNANVVTKNNSTLNYIATPVAWDWQKIVVDDELAQNIGTKYKAAVLRDGGLVHYFINDTLVFSDNNEWNMGFNRTNPITPMIYNAWGGSAKVTNLVLLTDSSQVDAKLRNLSGLSSEEPEAFKEAKVIIVAGQSNAEGFTPVSDLTPTQRKTYSPTSESVQIYYDCMSGQNNHTRLFDFVTYGQGLNKANMGPEVGLAYKLRLEDPTSNYYIIKVALGGSNLFHQWLSRSSGVQGNLYTRLMNNLYECENFFRLNNVSYSYKGFCWMQGEADACNKDNAATYYDNMKAFYQDICSDLYGHTSEDGLIFVDAAIKGTDNTWAYHAVVNDAKSRLASEFDNYYYLDTNRMGLVTRSVDAAHYDGMSCITLGMGFADTILQ